jgi:hypothetical protein
LPREAQIMPFPREEVTPPVTNMYLVAIAGIEVGVVKQAKICVSGA